MIRRNVSINAALDSVASMNSFPARQAVIYLIIFDGFIHLFIYSFMDFTGCQWRSVMGRFYSAVTIALSFRLYFFGAVLSVSLPLSLSLGPDSCVIYVWRVHRLYWDTRPAGLIKWQNEQPTCFSFMFLPIKKEEGEAKSWGEGSTASCVQKKNRGL